MPFSIIFQSLLLVRAGHCISKTAFSICRSDTLTSSFWLLCTSRQHRQTKTTHHRSHGCSVKCLAILMQIVISCTLLLLWQAHCSHHCSMTSPLDTLFFCSSVPAEFPDKSDLLFCLIPSHALSFSFCRKSSRCFRHSLKFKRPSPILNRPSATDGACSYTVAGSSSTPVTQQHSSCQI